MPTVTITSKGQMTLPKAIRDDLKVKPGDKLDIDKIEGKYVLQRRRSTLDLLAELPPYQGPAHTVEEMDDGIGEAVSIRNRSR